MTVFIVMKKNMNKIHTKFYFTVSIYTYIYIAINVEALFCMTYRAGPDGSSLAELNTVLIMSS